MDVKIERVATTRDMLGEGPLWDEREQALYWIDSSARVVHRLDHKTGELRHWGVPQMIGCMALREAGGAVVVLESGFYTLDFDTGQCTQICDPAADDPRTRFNDGKVDRQGRFVAGTMIQDFSDESPIAHLYRLSPDHSVETLDSQIVLSNGPCFSPDGKTLYFSDSLARVVYAYDYDTDGGAIGPRRVHIDVGRDHDGAGDGATVDSEGNLWVALVLNRQIGKFDPDGILMETLNLPVRYPTSVMFGGPNLDQLYVTSISSSGGLNATGPMDGTLLKITGHGATGIAEPRFKG
ncbi:MAG: SMP-30/gluconolactonase/LRE family protein [Alphaproteobacteria bacterium]